MTPNQTIDGVPREPSNFRLCPRCANNGRSDDCKECQGRVAWYAKPPSEAFTEWYCRNPYENLANSTAAWMAFKAGRDHASAAAQKPAAQPQGEPVHECQKCNGRGSMPARHAGEGETEYRARCKLYAEQPAPVAVTLQQVLTAYEYAESHPHRYLRGTTNWCAAVACSLNTK